ncbi:MAG: phenylacetate--CoA ligase family protein [Nitrospinota bacterium]
MQERKLRALMRTLAARSPFYRRKFDEAGIVPDSIRSLDDLRRLPTVDKEDHKRSQQEHPPYGDIHIVDVKASSRLHGSGGTTGRPLLYLDTRRSFSWIAEMWAYGLYAQGIRPGSVFLMPSGYNMFIGFWGAHYAVEKVGGVVVPSGSTPTDRRVRMIRDFACTHFMCTPSYALHMGAVSQEEGIDTRSSTIRSTHHAAEPGASIPATKKRIEDLWGADCYDNYGMVELGTISLYECPAKAGMHVIEDNFIAECLDPVTGEPAPDGEVGEIVWTSLGVRSFEVLPLLRYRSKDLAAFTSEPCSCGRTFKRLVAGIRGKLDDVKKVKGVNIFPPAIEETLAGIEALTHEWEAVIERVKEVDKLTVRGEVHPDVDRARWPSIQKEVQQALAASLLIQCGVELVEAGEIGKKFADVLKPGWKRIEDKRDVPF